MDLRLSQVATFLPGAKQPLFRVPELTVGSGERVLIHGPSGRGKTTLLHLMAGLMPPSEGDVVVGGQNLRFLSESQRARLRRQSIGIVFQRLNLLDHLTAYENASLLAAPGTTAAQVSEVLARLQLTHAQATRTATLSLGEQQRVAAARTVLQQPRLVLADEPTSSLDAENARAVMEALLGIPTKPTVVLVSHDERVRLHFSRALAFGEIARC